MHHFRRNVLRWGSTCLAMAGAMSAVACGGTDTGAGVDNITNVEHSPVKSQSIGNCWTYATVGWVESLHLAQSGAVVDFSESYLTYWRWFDQIAAGEEVDEIASSGSYGIAAELMLRYGFMQEADFISEDGGSIISDRQKEAETALKESLKSGVLSDAHTRRDRVLVRKELDRIFGLAPHVIALLNEAFGEDAQRHLDESSPPEFWRAVDIAVKGDAPDQILTMADRLGTRDWINTIDQRSGEYAWSQTRYPSKISPPFATDYDLRIWQTRIQRAMHDGHPVMISWLVDFNAADGNAFRAPPEEIGRQGGHQVLLEDYEIDNVPGFGTLKAGEEVSDPAALDAALDPSAIIKFLRVKNSWGTSGDPTESGDFQGYFDIYMNYLNGPVARCNTKDDETGKCVSSSKGPALNSAVLPPGY